MEFNAFRSTGMPAPRPDVTPLLDVLLALMVMFVLLRPSYEQPAGLVDEYLGCGPPSCGPRHTIARIDRTGAMSVNRSPVPEAKFVARLAQATEGYRWRQVFVVADGSLRYETVLEFLDLCHRAGVLQLFLVLDDSLDDTHPRNL